MQDLFQREYLPVFVDFGQSVVAKATGYIDDRGNVHIDMIVAKEHADELIELAAGKKGPYPVGLSWVLMSSFEATPDVIVDFNGNRVNDDE